MQMDLNFNLTFNRLQGFILFVFVRFDKSCVCVCVWCSTFMIKSAHLKLKFVAFAELFFLNNSQTTKGMWQLRCAGITSVGGVAIINLQSVREVAPSPGAMLTLRKTRMQKRRNVREDAVVHNALSSRLHTCIKRSCCARIKPPTCMHR